MSDDKKNTGAADRARIAADERYEVEHVARKFGVSAEEVVAAIHAVGPMRDAVERRLRERGTGSSR